MSTVPEFTKDIDGQCYGGAFWGPAEYRIHINHPTEAEPDDKGFLLWVEEASGNRVGVLWLTPELVDGITSMASTDHSLSGYEDDWTIPAGMERTIEWTLQTDINHTVRLDEADIDEVATWLRFATGEEEWTGGEDWEF